MTINLIDARRGLHDKCLELFADKKIAEQIYRYLCDGIEECEEAEPTKHGRWVWNKRLGEWYCSNCDRIMTPYTVENSEGECEMAQPFYCGWCGAKMDEVEE